MNSDDILIKTGRGAEALRTRSADLPQRMRTALILVDGQRSVAQLRSAASLAGAPPDSLETLLDLGLVQVQPQAAPPSPAGLVQGAALMSPSERCRLASKTMNDAVVDAMGLRAFFLTLKIEKCTSAGDLLALLPEVMQAIEKTRGPHVALALVQRIRAQLQ
jgi:hypothetical protein